MLKNKKILFLVAVVFLGGMFFLNLKNVFATDTTTGSTWNISSVGGYGLPSGKITDIIKKAVNWILGIFGFIGVIGFVISGIMYLTAAGNAEQEKTAKKAMTMSIIGVIVGLVGFVAIKAIDAMLNAKSGY